MAKKTSKNPVDIGVIPESGGAKSYTVPTCQICGSLMFDKVRTGDKKHDTLEECADNLVASIGASYEMFAHYNKHVAIFAEKVKWALRDAAPKGKSRKPPRKSRPKL